MDGVVGVHEYFKVMKENASVTQYHVICKSVMNKHPVGCEAQLA